ncbi:MAG: hypothetical protein AAF465_00505 [Pseudomonadota bacterium]
MSENRGAEIERFYWLLVNLLGKAFGFLMLIAGGLFFVAYGIEALRTGQMTWNGQTLTEFREQWPLLLGGGLTAALGFVLIKLLPIKRTTE